MVEGVVFTAFAGFVGEAHYRAFFVSRGSCGKEEVDGRLILLRRGIGRGCEDTSRRVVRIVGAESMGLCIFDIDDLSFCLKFPVLQDERHVAVLGIVADVGDADTVAASPGSSAGAGGGGDVGGKLGGHGGTVQVLVVVVAGCQCEGEHRKCKKSCLHYICHFISYKSAFTSSPFTSSQPLISAPSTSMPSGVSTSVPPRVSDSPFPVLNSLRASVRSLFSVVGVGLPSA